MIDWTAFERAAKLVAGSGTRTDGASLLRLRSKIVGFLDEASRAVSETAELPATPKAELLVVDRHAWIAGNVTTLNRFIGDLELTSAEGKLLALEGGAFVGMLARSVLGQYDPFRDQLVIVYPNLGSLGDLDGLRWLVLHEVTHVAQFRAAPWMADRIVDSAKEILAAQQAGAGRDMWNRIRERMPEIVAWARDVMEGKAKGSPLLDLLPDEQREAIERVNAMVTLLEGHATYVTELAATGIVENQADLDSRLQARKKRPPLLRLLEGIAGIDLKRQQYVTGRAFCEAVWQHGGAEALAPAWTGPDAMPTMAELEAPDAWLARVHAHTPAS